MARSSNVYVVVPKDCMTPIAGFTVKHELMDFLSTRAVKFRVWRVSDGAWKPKVTDITEDCYADGI
jgi:hypothetical protein